MGVPKFYRWISERYPLINQLISTSAVLPEFDHLYLDMNGILHACSHPNDDKLYSKLPEKEIIWSIFRYLDRIISEIVKPKKLIYMAIDGVAPRAKLNQQRARRFRAAQDRQKEVESKAKEFFSDRGVIVSDPDINKDDIFDSNCITPGTEFMDRISSYIRWFIREKIKSDPLWRDLKIIFSGHDVPGEGEHKIMEFIRNYRNGPEYVPNTRHCMYGQDADLIMLGLATHETHFALLREVINFNTFSKRGQVREIVMRQSREAQFQLLHISLLREYLHLDFGSKIMSLTETPEGEEPTQIDQERLIDDFIFLTFLVGNDFLPHLPTLDIGEHAFEFLFNIYCSIYSKAPGYIVENGQIGDFDRLENLFKLIGEREITILTDREKEDKSFRERRRQFNSEGQNEIELAIIEFEKQEEYEKARCLALGIDFVPRELPGNIKLEAKKEEANTEDEDGEALEENYNNYSEESLKMLEYLNSEKDFHGRYYFEKFNIILDTLEGNKFLTNLTIDYLKGLQWCLAYYIRGCISWTWYYPYHYGPMLMDMKNLKLINSNIKFTLGQPFTPLQQLLGCLPPFSSNLLPVPYRWLMTSKDSPIIDFYPEDFEVDQDGKKNPWEAVVCLDFIDEKRLIEAEKKYCPPSCLNRTETLRNTFGNISLFEYDPSITSTYLSCSPENNIPDIINCYSRETPLPFSLEPGQNFLPKVMPGTIYPIAGYPSLSTLPIIGVKEVAAKLNVFGSGSKYKSLILTLNSNPLSFPLEKLQPLIGKTVFVNYPQVHEAQIIGITTKEGEAKYIDKSSGLKLSTEDAIRELENSLKGVKISQAEIEGKGNHLTTFNRDESARWKANALAEAAKYLTGRGTPGNCGLEIGEININLIVRPLQGLKRDYKTGKTVKIYANSLIASVPIQMALFNPPCVDLRFKESDELPLDVLYPVGSEVVAVGSELIGCKGTVIATSKKSSVRTVDVEFTIPIPEPPFGYSIARSITDKYFSSTEICKLLKISGSVLGKIVGSIRLTPIRYDLGLNLKRNGMYQLLGYVRRVDPSNDYETGNRQIWTGVESVHIVGVDSLDVEVAKQTGDLDSTYWEYSAQAAALLFEYKERFPILFERLQQLPHAQQYKATELLGSNATKVAELIDEWMKSCPFYTMPRTPLTTVSLNKESMIAIEKAADMYHAKVIGENGSKKVVVKGFPIDKVYTNIHRSVHDVSLSFNLLEPRLGDRVVNLCATGVPFGLRGTVVTIHKQTQYVEVIFDEEFIGGRNLQGNCSQFRGRLCTWADLILVSDKMDYRNPQKLSTTTDAEEDSKILSKLQEAVATKNNPPVPKTLNPPPANKTLALKSFLKKNDDNSSSSTPTPLPNPPASAPLPSPIIFPPVPPLAEVVPPVPENLPLPELEPMVQVKIIEEKKFQDDDEDDFHVKLRNKLDLSKLTSDGSGYNYLLSLGDNKNIDEEIENKQIDFTHLFGTTALLAEAHHKHLQAQQNSASAPVPAPVPAPVSEATEKKESNKSHFNNKNNFNNNNKPNYNKNNNNAQQKPQQNKPQNNDNQVKPDQNIPTNLKNLEVKEEIKPKGFNFKVKLLTKTNN